ncbi:MAG: type II secretion system protein [Candidatus Paceibacterota bacterium]
MKNNFKNKKGFTLVEILIYVVIFSILVTAMVSFGSSMTSARLKNQMTLEVNDQGAKVMKIIVDAIQNAHSVNSPTIASSASSLSVVTEIPSTSPTVFYESSGILYTTEGGMQPIALTNNKVVVSNLLFSNFSHPDTPDIIKVSFTLGNNTEGNSLGGMYSFSFNGSASLRK